MKLTIPILTLTSILGSNPNTIEQCEQKNLQSLTEIVEATNEMRCDLKYDDLDLVVNCEYSQFTTSVRGNIFNIFIEDENNSLLIKGAPRRALLVCKTQEFELTDEDQLAILSLKIKRLIADLEID